jgi:hypothetical protein
MNRFLNMNKKKEYLSILFRGGPANRFYQYHTATYLAKIWNKKFVFDPSKALPNGMHHDPEFKITNFFKCNATLVPKYHLTIRQFDVKGRINPKWKDDLLKMDTPAGNVLLTDGWYQTFWDNHITLPKLQKSRIYFNENKTVFVHVRRGDYLKSRIYLNLTAYYEQAHKKMEQLFSDSTYLICSDDIQWCKNNLNFIENPCFLENVDYKKTLWLMSQCKRGAILSNSTYGLWGAYLARINNKLDPSFRVFMPSQWAATTDIRNYDMDKYIYPSWSEKIEV